VELLELVSFRHRISGIEFFGHQMAKVNRRTLFLKEETEGNCKGKRGKGMEPALWVVQGTPGRGGKLAAASRR